MYSEIRNVQILVALLKKYNICDVVISAGGSSYPLIASLEQDDFFNCYPLIDERSVTYFAMGLAQQKDKIVACVCTSGTAVTNYLSGVTEAYYQNVPLVIITADRMMYYSGQMETQKILQADVFGGVVKKAVELPVVKDDEDAWYCNRLINEALLALNWHGKGPVHINIPTDGRRKITNCSCLPDERKIDLVQLFDKKQVWKAYADKLINKKIMVVVGQNVAFSKDDIANMNIFFKRFDCIYAVEHLSNLNCDGVVYVYPYAETRNSVFLGALKPDIIISIGNNFASSGLKNVIRESYNNIENWLISDKGEVKDTYKCLTTIFECTHMQFFKEMASFDYKQKSKHKYYDMWNIQMKTIRLPRLEFSSFYAAKKISEIIPRNSLLHLAVNSSIRNMSFFELREGVRTYCNIGALGIDGCLSTFVGQAKNTDSLAFLLIGDLSFFYDMNAAGILGVGSNIRIICFNNGGGAEFNFYLGNSYDDVRIKDISSNATCEHKLIAEGWIKSLGYDYYSAKNKEEFDSIVDKFAQESDKPMFLEVYTDKVIDGEVTNLVYDMNRKGIDLDEDLRLKELINGRKIACFAAGSMCKDFISIKETKIDVVIDNSEIKKGTYINGVEVMYSKDITDWSKYFVIITCINTKEIEEQLQSYGLIKNKDYICGIEVY